MYLSRVDKQPFVNRNVFVPVLEYYVQVGAALDTTGPRCRAEVDNATKTMYDWWGQPAKREEMQLIFKLVNT